MTTKPSEELFNEVRKLFNLKNTEFIIEPNLDTSICDTDTEDGITRCYRNKFSEKRITHMP